MSSTLQRAADRPITIRSESECAADSSWALTPCVSGVCSAAAPTRSLAPFSVTSVAALPRPSARSVGRAAGRSSAASGNWRRSRPGTRCAAATAGRSAAIASAKTKWRMHFDNTRATPQRQENASRSPVRGVDSLLSVQVRGASVLLTELLTVDRVRVPLGSRTKSDVLRELVELAATRRNADSVESMLAAVREREQVLSTGIGGGVAIPHGKTPHVDQLMLAAGVARDAIDFDALDGQPVHLFFLLVGPESASGAHVKALSRISRLLRRDRLRTDLLAAPTAEAFLDVIRRSEAA